MVMEENIVGNKEEFAKVQIGDMVRLMRQARKSTDLMALKLLQKLKSRLNATNPYLVDRGTREYPDLFKKLLAAHQHLGNDEWCLAAAEIEDILSEMLDTQGPDSNSTVAFDRIVIGNLWFLLDSAGV